MVVLISLPYEVDGTILVGGVLFGSTNSASIVARLNFNVCVMGLPNVALIVVGLTISQEPKPLPK
jgi:hypothetical protein